jgi:serine/threonine protein kinase
MPATSESIAALPPLQRRMADAWLMRFEENWNDQKLRDCMRALPDQSSLRRPLLIAMIERDLNHRWDSGQPSTIENYLKEFPELGGVEEIPVELLAAEYKARQKHNNSDLADFAERFPTRIDDLYLFLKPGLFESKVPIGQSTLPTTDSMSARRMQLLRAPAEAGPSESLSKQRLKLLRSSGGNNPADPQITRETVQDLPPPKLPQNAPPAGQAASSPTVWLDIQTVRSNHAAGRSGVIKPEANLPPLPFKAVGRYTIEKRLGGSGAGSIYLAIDSQLNRRIALRIPQFGGPSAAATQARFHHEGRAAMALCHPLLCPVLDVGQNEGVDFLAMPYVDGDPLSDVLKQRPVWPARHAVDLVLKLAIALDAAHRQGVFHRDLKPSNILIAPSETPVVVGFGQPAAKTAYSAPETNDAADPRGDIYSLGMILHQLLTGQLPQPNEGAYFFPADLDLRLQKACRRATAPKAEQRFGSMRELINDLTEYRQSHQSSDAELRLPLGGSTQRRQPPAPPPAAAPKGLSTASGWDVPNGLSAVPGFGVGQEPGAKPKSAPGAGSPTFAQMQELRAMSSQNARPQPPRKPGRRKMQQWKYLAVGAVGGIILVWAVLSLTSSRKPRNNSEQTPQTSKETPDPKPPTVQELSDQLKAPSVPERVAAIARFPSCKEPEAVDALIQFIGEGAWLKSDPDGADRTAALEAIKKMDNAKIVDAVKQAFVASDLRVRWWAVGKIAALAEGDFKDDLMPLLVAALRGNNPDLRRGAAEAIQKERINSERIIKALVERVTDDQWGVPPRTTRENTFERSPDKDGGKEAAVAALFEIAPQKVRPALEAAAQSRNPDVKLWALDKLKVY